MAFAGIAHRGPDDKGEWRNEKILMCQTRLSIIDLSSGGHQPMLNDNGNLVIVFNGEIYNYSDLKKDLESQGVHFKSKSDTEVILRGFEKYGEDFFVKLRGMWAFAIYDSNKDTILLSRDQFGIKPLYYAKTGSQIVFGSEIKAVIPYLQNLNPNSSNYFTFLNLGYFPGEHTSFDEIKKVLPGEIIYFDCNSGKKTSKFVDLPKAESFFVEDINTASDLIQKGLIDSMEKHFVSDVPVGLLLSGGNDSSFIASLSKELGKTPTCFNVSIEGSLDNNYAEKVAKHLNLPFESIKIKNREFEEQYNKIWEIIDQPTSDVSFIPTSLVYSLIKGKSKVVLSGEGGDELFGGYLRHRKFSAIEEMSFSNFFPDFSRLSKQSLGFTNPIINRMRDLFGIFESMGSLYLYNSRQIDLGIKQREMLKFFDEYYNNHPYKKYIQPNLFFDFFMYIPHSLMYKGDMSSMAYGIESRVPFLDKEFFKIISSISPRMRLSKEFTDKNIIKKTMLRYLPEELVYRKKTGFGININNYGDLVIKDLLKAIEFHVENKSAFGILDAGLESVIKKENVKILLKKYPRFAFALISNHKVMKDYVK